MENVEGLIAAMHAADAAHDANVARGASVSEVEGSYLACLRAQLAFHEGMGDEPGVQVLRATIAKGAA